MEMAKISTRITAFVIDFFIYWVIIIVLGYFFDTPTEDGENSLTGMPALFAMLIGIFLWPISESIWGQTLGKRMMKLKVVKDDLNSIGFGKAFGRFALGWVDMLFVIGILIAYNNDQNKRIGDLVAKTKVIKLDNQ